LALLRQESAGRSNVCANWHQRRTPSLERGGHRDVG
jgi:hypothetical protein